MTRERGRESLVGRLREAVRGRSLGATLGRGAAASVVATGLGAAAAVGAQIYLSRSMGEVEWGYFAFAFNCAGLLMLIARLGFDTAEVRFVAAYRVAGNWPALRGLLAFGDRAVLLAGLGIAALSAVAIAAVSSRLEEGFAPTLWIACTVVPLWALLGLRTAALQGFRKVGVGAAPEALLRQVATVVLAAAAFAWAEPKAPWAMAAYALAVAVSLVAGELLLRGQIPVAERRGPKTEERRLWTRTALPLLLVTGMRRLLHQTDVLLVGILVGTTVAGIYTVAARISRLVTFGLQAGNSIAAPLISELHTAGDLPRLQRMVTMAAWGSTLSSGLFAAVLGIGGPFFLRWWGAAFENGAPILWILALGQVVNASTGPVGYLLNMTGHQAVNARILAWITGANLVLNLPAILLFGALGAATVTSSLVAVKNLWSWFEVRRRLGVNSSIFGSLRAADGGAA